MHSLTEAFAILDAVVRPCNLQTENIKTIDGLGRILGCDQFSLLDLPPFNRATMDGYAILTADTSASYEIIEVVAAGNTAQKILQPGTCIKIMTGAPVPENTGKIVPIELTTEKNNRVTILQQPKGANIAMHGEDVKCNEMLLPRGTFLQAAQVANLIACGLTEITVLKKPKVAIISTGNEVVDHVSQIVPGKIMNSNAPLLQTLCLQCGCEVTMNITVADNVAATLDAVNNAANNADILILSGGVSAGDFDYVPKALELANFKIHFERLALKPGRPTTFATRNAKLVFALPGNPVAVFLTFHLFVLHALRSFLAMPYKQRYITLPAACEIQRRSTERAEFIPCTLQDDGSVLPMDFHGSGHLAALLKCDGFCYVAPGIAQLAAKTPVSFLFTR
jgi:molybdopterin molybdotransferase